MAGDAALGVLGRAFDLTVVGQPSSDGSAITTLEAALFESGGPILIAAPKSVATLGDTVVIVWNGSTETARTIGLAKHVLQQAKRVVLLSDDGALNHKPSGEMVQRRLKRNGINAELINLPRCGIRSGETILREASARGCDLLVKGAYTQSRIRQMIFGGATKHLIENAAMPVMMAH